MKINKNNYGITLISLIVTIIVLIILAGISIASITGNNGILKRAEEAKNKTEVAKLEEQEKLNRLEAASNINGTITSEGVHIPANFAVSSKEGENSLEDSLVIVDSLGNEYVWIEVPNDGTGPVYTAVTTKENDSPEYYTAIASALRLYCSKDMNNEDLIKETTYSAGYSGKNATYGYKDIWYSGCGISSQEEYTELYNSMLKSVYENGGFWIGRYEAGIENTARGSIDDSIDGLIPCSKANLYPINYVTCSQAQTIATRIKKDESYTSSLMFGIQWDLVIKHLNNKGVETSILNGDNSNIWGNYHDNSFNIDRGMYCATEPWNTYINYKTATENKVTVQNNVSTKVGTTDENKILLTTGASETNCKKNIYDLAGNIYELTLEKSSADFLGKPSVVRGGGFVNCYAPCSVAQRVFHTSTQGKYYVGFRVSIF